MVPQPTLLPEVSTRSKPPCHRLSKPASCLSADIGAYLIDQYEHLKLPIYSSRSKASHGQVVLPHCGQFMLPQPPSARELEG